MESIYTRLHIKTGRHLEHGKNMCQVNAIRALQWWHVITIKLNHSTSQFLKLHPLACIVYYYFILFFFTIDAPATVATIWNSVCKRTLDKFIGGLLTSLSLDCLPYETWSIACHPTNHLWFVSHIFMVIFLLVLSRRELMFTSHTQAAIVSTQLMS